MARPQGGKDFAPLVRSALARACRDPKVDLEKKLAKALMEDPVGTLKSLAAYAPKQVDVNQDVTYNVSVTESERTDMALVRQLRAAREAQEGNVTH